MPALLLAAFLTYLLSSSISTTLCAVGGFAVAWFFACILFFDHLIRPLQTLSNVVAALREDDFSFRARGACRGDALGDLALEINTLAATLQHQRATALDALTLVEEVLTSMQSPVLAFDSSGNLQLHNAAAKAAFALGTNPNGRPAMQLDLASLLDLSDHGMYPAQRDGPARWSVRRTTFRLHGLPHTLLVFTDVAAVLREEERLAWQRLIRVLSHEINNSLTPIQSIAGSLRARVTSAASATPASAQSHTQDLLRGLGIIEDRATSLHRFLQAYHRLARLPAPSPRPVDLPELLAQVAQLETRLQVHLRRGEPILLSCDPDQIQQALINLVQNAADSALSAAEATNTPRVPAVTIAWRTSSGSLIISIEDNGLGISNTANLFVPFYTTKPHGSGIGLVLAQQIATAHRGSIAIFSNSGQTGCTANFTLPLASPNGSQLDAPGILQ